jgi:hypothetical protein
VLISRFLVNARTRFLGCKRSHHADYPAPSPTRSTHTARFPRANGINGFLFSYQLGSSITSFCLILTVSKAASDPFLRPARTYQSHASHAASSIVGSSSHPYARPNPHPDAAGRLHSPRNNSILVHVSVVAYQVDGMVDSVASVVTLAQVSLVLIKTTYNFIRDAQVIDSLVEKLQLSLRDLYKLIKLVELTCKQSRIRENDLSHFIQGALTRCGRRLKGVDVMVHRLAAKKTGTFLRRAALKIRSDRAKKDIEEAIGDIKELMDQIHKGISLCTLYAKTVMDSF